MTKEKLIAELGKKSSLFGGPKGGEFDDLDKIAKELGTNKTGLLNSNKIKDIHVEKIKVRYGEEIIDAIQFFYKVATNDKTYSIEGSKHGGNGGKEATINLETGEYILRVSGKSTTKYGNDGELFDLPACACIFGKSGANLDALGMYEAKEIIRLKRQELAPQVRNEKDRFEQLITNAKTKAGNLEKIIDLLLETQKQIGENKQGNDQLAQARLEGQLTAYQNVLEGNLTKEELQALLNKQIELCQLEKHLASLQINEQTAQIIQPTYGIPEPSKNN
ncbi:9985_t:CDS:2 [Entrophospora sp. SA101]|nr:1602_t:CDS:2 [Entrophospora sp. SA101]CAJ0836782.1 8508_t:CDS:2 [Entrophospora sp. SA101]CAJ0876287.1 9985_t:CDS:2 [Entrophospora sp. SA101]